MRKLIASGIAIVFIVMTSCNQDSAKPNLGIGTPNDNSVFILPDTFNVDASLQEGVMEQYKVELILNDPCEMIDTTSTGFDFSLSSYLFVSGTGYNQNTFSHTVMLEDDFTPGEYSCIVSAIVGQYNEGKDTVTIYLQNLTDTVKPVASISEPAGPETLNKGDTLRVFGLMDEKKTGMLQGVVYRVKMDLRPNFSGQSDLTVLNSFKPTDDSLKVKYEIPTSIVSGAYTLYITLLDEYNNFTIYTYSITVN